MNHIVIMKNKKETIQFIAMNKEIKKKDIAHTS